MPLFAQRYLFDPVLACGVFALVLSTATLLSLLCGRLGGVFGEAVQPSANKLASLEGLRGILALSVAAHHAYCWYFFTKIHDWGTGHSILFARFANFGVIQFFFISGYLFWRKLMKKGGIELGRFYLSRFVRLAPVYYVCVGIAIFIGLTLSGFRLLVPAHQLATSLVPWLLFSLGGEPTVNGADVKRIVSGVVWTLANEWLFYLALPLLGWFARKSQRLIHLALLFGFIFVVSKFLSSGRVHQESVVGGLLIVREFARFMLMGFGGGILIAAFQEKIRQRLTLSVSSRNWLLLALYAIYLLIPEFRGFLVIGVPCLLAAFALVITGSDLFGFITSRPVRFLGIISYDLYLVHGITYYIAMRLRGGMHPVQVGTYIAQTAVCFVVIVLVSTALYFLVERPSMKLSEKIARRAGSTPQISNLAEPVREAVSG